jgi:peptidoglycan-N-acetylglucosamine deacetylase
MQRLACVSVDLDEIHHYEAIHGLGPASPSHAVYDLAVPRFEAFSAAAGLPLTFFVVGEDVERPANKQTLERLTSAGHELGNHSWRHRYDLTLLSSEQMRSEVERGARAIEAATGVRPSGFRAPGYLLNDRLARVLEACAVSYDSSVFPCPTYYAAKLAALAAHRLRGRASRSLVDSPKVLLAPRTPYRIGSPYFRRGRGLLELPIQVTPGLRLPVIGTALTLAGPTLAGWLLAQVAHEPFVNLEFHGMDLLEVGDGLRALARYQPDLNVPLAKKRAALRSVVELLRARGFRFVRLDQAARSFQAEP